MLSFSCSLKFYPQKWLDFSTFKLLKPASVSSALFSSAPNLSRGLRSDFSLF